MHVLCCVFHMHKLQVYSSIFFIHSCLKSDGCEVSCGIFVGSKAAEQPPMSLNYNRDLYK